MRGVSLEEIAESTKIGTRSLRALEDEDFEKLPGGIFNRGFVRAYSRFLGLDEEQTVADFDSAWKEYQAEKAPPPAVEAEENTEEKKSGQTPLVVGALLLIVVAAGTWFWVNRQKVSSAPDTPSSTSISQPPESTPSQPVAPAPSTAAPPQSAAQTVAAPPIAESGKSTGDAAKSSKPEVMNSGPNPSSPTSQKSGKPAEISANSAIHLEVFAREDSWLSVSADGKNLGQGILAAQKSRTIRAQREVRLRVGNVAAVEVSFNGRPINIDGEPKQAKNFIFTPDGLRQ